MKCAKVFSSPKTCAILDKLLAKHQIDCQMLNKEKKDNHNQDCSTFIQSTHDVVNICPLSPQRIEQLKNLLFKFAIVANVPALAM